MKDALIARLVMSGILLSTSVGFVFRAVFVARLVISGILISLSAAFLLRFTLVTNPITLSIFF